MKFKKRGGDYEVRALSRRNNIRYKPLTRGSQLILAALFFASGKEVKPDHVREVIWKPALKKAGVEYRPMMQTRHTFATMMIDAGEDIGWVQKMLGHGSLQMIYTKYYSWIKKNTRNDGAEFMKNLYRQTFEQKDNPVRLMKEGIEIFTPNLP